MDDFDVRDDITVQLIMSHPAWKGPMEALHAAALRKGFQPLGLKTYPSADRKRVHRFWAMQSYRGDYGIVLVRWDPSWEIKEEILEEYGLTGDLQEAQWAEGSGGRGSHPRDFPARMKFLRLLQETFESARLGFNQETLTVGPHQLFLVFKGPKGSLSVQWNWKKASPEYF